MGMGKALTAAAALGAAKMAELAKAAQSEKAPLQERNVPRKKGTTQVLRNKNATRKEEMERRKDLRDGWGIAQADLTKDMMEGKTLRLKTGKYVPAGRFKNIPAGNR